MLPQIQERPPEKSDQSPTDWQKLRTTGAARPPHYTHGFQPRQSGCLTNLEPNDTHRVANGPRKTRPLKMTNNRPHRQAFLRCHNNNSKSRNSVRTVQKSMLSLG